MSFHLKGTHEVVTKGGGLTEIFLVLFVKIHKREEEIKHGKARENFCACVCFFFFGATRFVCRCPYSLLFNRYENGESI